MQMQNKENQVAVITDQRTQTTYTRIDHKSGLTIYVCEMEGFSTTKALFATKYGSINTCFKTVEEEDFCQVPEGIAHFLEHKLFENQDGDVFQLYAKTGANANAYTSFDKTCYLFSCSDHYEESLEILLRFVQDPYFTAESVAKEQGIIGQEIRMHNDDPEWRVFFNMLQAMYQQHPVRIDIAGTEESIAQITDSLLYRCYHTFYNLHNMVLCVSGNCKTETILELADRLLKPCEPNHLEMIFPEEPDTVLEAEHVEYAPVGIPIFNLGIKCRPASGYEGMKKELTMGIALSCIIGSSTPFYHDLMTEGLINETFGKTVFNGDGFFNVIFEGESTDIYTVRNRIFAAITAAKETGVDAALFEELRRSIYGSMIRELNSVSAVASLLQNSHLFGIAPFDGIRILSELTVEDCNRCLREDLNLEHSVLSIVCRAEDAPDPDTEDCA